MFCIDFDGRGAYPLKELAEERRGGDGFADVLGHYLKGCASERAREEGG
jgi:hypothetical protein